MQSKYAKDRLYHFNGTEFVELEPSGQNKVPVTDEAMEVIKQVRKAAQAAIGMRPELSLVASALILEASHQPNIAESVRVFSQRVYGITVDSRNGSEVRS